MFTRSTKGASKQRRELINVEINGIRALLPLQEGVRKRLSQLQVMAICKAFIGKNNFFEKIPSLSCASSDETFDFSQALSGFLLMASIDGKFLYLSDNIMEILGHSMVDFITQSESIFDLFDEKGQAKVMELLSGAHGNCDNMMSSDCGTGGCSQDEATFTCLMGMTKNVRRHPGLDRQKVMKVRACLVKPQNCFDGGEPVLMAFCSPCSYVMPTGEPAAVFNTMVYQTRHRIDMKYLDIDANGEFHLGYSAKDLHLRSWYEFIHPDHEAEFTSKYMELISSNADSVSSIFLRIQTRYGHFIWVHVIMRLILSNDLCSGNSEIACVSHVLTEEEVVFMKERERQEAEMSNCAGSLQIFENAGSNIFPFSANGMDDHFLVNAPTYVGPADLWNEPTKILKRKATGGDLRGKPRKSAKLTVNEDSISISGSSSMSFSSPVSLDMDQFQFSHLDSYPHNSYSDVIQPEIELKAEDSFQPNSWSPYSMHSESTSGRSPRMYPEDDSLYFFSMSAAPDQKNIFEKVKVTNSLPYVSGVIGPLDDLDDTLPSPMQEVPNELPELDLKDLQCYLNSVEDGKKHGIFQNVASSSYVEALLTADTRKQQNQKEVFHKSNALAYEYPSLQRADVLGSMSKNTANGAVFSGPEFLERLIESPQFTKLIGIMANGNQRRADFQKQGLSCFG